MGALLVRRALLDAENGQAAPALASTQRRPTEPSIGSKRKPAVSVSSPRLSPKAEARKKASVSAKLTVTNKPRMKVGKAMASDGNILLPISRAMSRPSSARPKSPANMRADFWKKIVSTAAFSPAVGDTLQAYRQDGRLNGAVTFGVNAIVVQGDGLLLRVGQAVCADFRFD